jgi:hypothetical protein
MHGLANVNNESIILIFVSKSIVATLGKFTDFYVKRYVTNRTILIKSCPIISNILGIKIENLFLCSVGAIMEKVVT